MRRSFLLYMGIVVVGILVYIFFDVLAKVLLIVLTNYTVVSIVYGLFAVALCPFYYYYRLKKEPTPNDPPFLYRFGPFPYLLIDSFGNVLFFYTSLAILFRLSVQPLVNIILLQERVVLYVAFTLLMYWAVEHTVRRFITTFRKELTVNIEEISTDHT